MPVDGVSSVYGYFVLLLVVDYFPNFLPTEKHQRLFTDISEIKKNHQQMRFIDYLALITAVAYLFAIDFFFSCISGDPHGRLYLT